MVNVGVTSHYSLGHERYNMLTTVDRQLWSMWGVTSHYSLGHERYNMLTTVDRQLWSMWGSHRTIVWDMRDTVC